MYSGRAAVYLTFKDDIKTFYAFVKTSAPLVLTVPAYNEALFASAEAVKVILREEGGFRGFAAETSYLGERDILVEPVSPEEEGAFPGSWADYKGPFRAAVIKPGEESFYYSLQKRINSRERNNTAARIREAMKKDGSENYEVLSFLLEINSKIDEILSLLKGEEALEDSFPIRGVSISGDGLRFYTEKPLENGWRVFITGTLAEQGGRTPFAAVASLEPVKINPDGSGIYAAGFLDLDEETKDGIIRFVFAREREILKESRI